MFPCGKFMSTWGAGFFSGTFPRAGWSHFPLVPITAPTGSPCTHSPSNRTWNIVTSKPTYLHDWRDFLFAKYNQLRLVILLLVWKKAPVRVNVLKLTPHSDLNKFGTPELRLSGLQNRRNFLVYFRRTKASAIRVRSGVMRKGRSANFFFLHALKHSLRVCLLFTWKTGKIYAWSAGFTSASSALNVGQLDLLLWHDFRYFGRFIIWSLSKCYDLCDKKSHPVNLDNFTQQ